MIFDQRVSVPGSLDDAWAFLMDIPAVGSCVPGVESMEPLGDDRFNAVMKVKVGSIRIRFEGTIAVVERDRAARHARLLAEGADRRVGGAVKAQIDMRLEPGTNGELEMLVHTDAQVLGKLGELGQAVMRKKSDQVMTQFAANMRAELGGEAATATAAPPPADETPGRASVWSRFVAWLRHLLGRRA